MTKQEIEFIKKSDKFIVYKDGERVEFSDYPSAATFYNSNVRTASKIELQAVCGMAGLTVAYHYSK